MSYYRVVLLGENYLVRLDGKKKFYGFYTTRFVEAKDPDTAELKAVDLIRADESLTGLVKNKTWQKQPMIYLDEMYEIAEAGMEDQHGFAWFPMED